MMWECPGPEWRCPHCRGRRCGCHPPGAAAAAALAEVPVAFPPRRPRRADAHKLALMS